MTEIKQDWMLIDDNGKEVQLPLTTKDFRGDPIVVSDFMPPTKPNSSGHIETSRGAVYYPQVARLSIIRRISEESI